MLNDSAKLVLRVSIGILMLFHGIYKIINGVGGVEEMILSVGLPAFFGWGVFIGEILAPIMLIIGFKTKIAASLMAATMIVAIVLVSKGNLFAINSSGGWIIELPILYLIASINIIFIGAGKFSLDEFRRNKKSK